MLAWRKRRDPDTHFLLAWIAIFFAGALAIFFAGSARYLLPIAAPVAILASRLPARWLAPAFAAQLALGLGLAAANYQHWDAYRQFAASLRAATAGHRVWVDDDWGLRYYIEADGGLPLTQEAASPGRHRGDQRTRPTASSHARRHRAVAQRGNPALGSAAADRPRIALRLLHGQPRASGPSASRPASWIDRSGRARSCERHPDARVPADERAGGGGADRQRRLRLENDTSAGFGERGRRAEEPGRAEDRCARSFTIPDNAPARRITLLLDGQRGAAPGLSRARRLHARIVRRARAPDAVADGEIRGGPDLHRAGRPARTWASF